MLSDDTYRNRLTATIAAIEAWCIRYAGTAAIETARDEATWRLALRPHAANACPLELSLRIDQQFDLQVGPESYEDQPIETLDQFIPMLSAIADGRVLTRTMTTAATGLVMEVATVLLSADGSTPLWQRSRRIASAEPRRDSEMLAQDRHYLPYARGA